MVEVRLDGVRVVKHRDGDLEDGQLAVFELLLQNEGSPHLFVEKL